MKQLILKVACVLSFAVWTVAQFTYAPVYDTVNLSIVDQEMRLWAPDGSDLLLAIFLVFLALLCQKR